MARRSGWNARNFRRIVAREALVKSDMGFSEQTSVQQQAREWLIRMDGDAPLGSSERAELREWLAKDPTHQAELKRIAAFWNRANILTELAVPLQRDALRGRIGRLIRFGADLRFGAAAVLCVALGATAWWLMPHGAANGTYGTAIGQQQTLALSDGSTVQINTDSQIQIDYSEPLRKIRLLRGEAFFTVAPNAKRPFEVFAAGGIVKAVGTAFAVSVQGAQVSVTVAKGVVDVGPDQFRGAVDDVGGAMGRKADGHNGTGRRTMGGSATGGGATGGSATGGSATGGSATGGSATGGGAMGGSATGGSATGGGAMGGGAMGGGATGGGAMGGAAMDGSATDPAAPLRGALSLRAGETVTVGSESSVKPRVVGEAELQRRLSWHEGYLVYSGQPLNEVVAEVNRYSTVALEIADPRLNSLAIGGRFKVGDLDAICDALQENFGIRVVRVDDQHIQLRLAPTS